MKFGNLKIDINKIIYINIYIVFMYVNTMGFLYWELNSGKFNVFE